MTDERHGKLIETVAVLNNHRRNNVDHSNKYLAIKTKESSSSPIILMEGASLAGNVQINVDDGCQVT